MAPFLSICLLLAVLLSTAEAIPTIHALGSKFFTSEGDQWFVKGESLFLKHCKPAHSSIGVAYQLIEDDPLVNTEQCERDAVLMHQLGANAIRVYHVNETADHTGCMNVFAAHGIYAFVDLDSFQTYIRYVRIAQVHQASSLTFSRTPSLRGTRAKLLRIVLLWTTSSSTTILQASSSGTRFSTLVRHILYYSLTKEEVAKLKQ